MHGHTLFSGWDRTALPDGVFSRKGETAPKMTRRSSAAMCSAESCWWRLLFNVFLLADSPGYVAEQKQGPVQHSKVIYVLAVPLKSSRVCGLRAFRVRNHLWKSKVTFLLPSELSLLLLRNASPAALCAE